MHNPFINALVKVLEESDRYRLSAIVEMANLLPSTREKLTQYYSERSWPLLQQAQFSNLRTIGPWLIGARPGAGVSAQYDFQWQLAQSAVDAVCGWIVSALPPAQLAQHLSQANIVTGTHGQLYLLRYHTAASLQVLDARRDLPGVSEWLAPIHRWWAPVANPHKKLWLQISGDNRPQATHVPPITLDEKCWRALAGDPLCYQLAELLKHEQSGPTLATNCHGTRLGLIQHYLTQACQQGLSREDDLITYVLIMSRNGELLSKMPAWQEALAATRDQQSSLIDNMQAYLRSTV
ncbi:DUF4123 domain-containing protein [Pseudomonas guariconensis]|uniref:DUF4123 domain-containing protein n=1 Tax=Pseudomonas TaxID=286 RepID=UPI0020979BB2|nr:MULTISPECIES: DUF4123 domain-containing protein [Pseudomonas]MCO7518023.1 DUF4123 domain-containing protein [Pseudomonas putida]MCO7608527.1 DUF4123 domain-containing protein [Pseudomonas guariconensis]